MLLYRLKFCAGRQSSLTGGPSPYLSNLVLSSSFHWFWHSGPHTFSSLPWPLHADRQGLRQACLLRLYSPTRSRDEHVPQRNRDIGPCDHLYKSNEPFLSDAACSFVEVPTRATPWQIQVAQAIHSLSSSAEALVAPSLVVKRKDPTEPFQASCLFLQLLFWVTM